MTSKILGIGKCLCAFSFYCSGLSQCCYVIAPYTGNVERSWGTVKHLKTDKRACLGSESTKKQSTLFGGNTIEMARLEQKKREVEVSGELWTDEDVAFNLGLEIEEEEEDDDVPPRLVYAFVEDWEHKGTKRKDDVLMKEWLEAKYKGLNFILGGSEESDAEEDSNGGDEEKELRVCVGAVFLRGWKLAMRPLDTNDDYDPETDDSLWNSDECCLMLCDNIELKQPRGVRIVTEDEANQSDRHRGNATDDNGEN